MRENADQNNSEYGYFLRNGMQLIFLLQNLCFLINFEKSILQACQRIVGDSCGLQRNDTHSPTEENKCKKRTVSIVSFKRSGDSAGNCSSAWETKFLCSSSSASRSPLQVLIKATNSRLFNAEKTLSISGGREKIDLVGKKPKRSNGRSLVNLKPQIIIASDASMIVLGAYC